MANKRLQRLLENVNEESIRTGLEQRLGRTIGISEVRARLKRLTGKELQQDQVPTTERVPSDVGRDLPTRTGVTGARARGIDFAKAVPEELLTPEQRKLKQAREALRTRQGEVEDIRDLSIEELATLAQRQPPDEADQERTGVGLGAIGLGARAGRAGIEFINNLFRQQEEVPTVTPTRDTGTITPNERQLRDEAALAIAKGADPTEVSKRLEKLLGGG